MCCCYWSPQLYLFAAAVLKGNEQPDEPSTTCISVLHERSTWCAKKAGSFKGVTSDMAHGQTYNNRCEGKCEWAYINTPGC